LAEQAKTAIPTTSQAATLKSTKRHYALGDVDGNVVAPPLLQQSPKHTMRERQIKVPKRFE
jgi:hypothetical protein